MDGPKVLNHPSGPTVCQLSSTELRNVHIQAVGLE